MKVVYVTSAMINCIWHEVAAHGRAGWTMRLVVDRRKKPNDEDRGFETHWRPPVPRLLGALATEFLRSPLRVLSLFVWPLPLLFGDPVEFLKAIYEIGPAARYAQLTRPQGVDHVHVHFASRSLSLGIHLVHLLSVPLSCTVHAFDIFMRTPKSLKVRLPYCAFIAAISQYNVDYLERVAGPNVSTRTRVIHAGLDLVPFRPRQGRPARNELLIVSNLVEKKGHADLLRACALLRQRGLRPRCRIVGDGELRGTLERLAEELDLEDQIEFLGRVSNDKLRDLLERATLFVLPATVGTDGNIDGIPMALMEAMAAEVPCLSTRVSGIPELIEDGVSGHLVEPSNPAALANRLQEVLAAPDDLERIARNGRTKVLTEFDVEATAGAVRDAIASCAHRSAP